MPKESEDDPAMEELTLSQIAQEFRINRGTLNNWMNDGILKGRKEFTEVGTSFWLVRRGEVERVLQSRSKTGRPLKRT
jgi:predicted site-specific integrase-resolvase